MLSEGKRYHLFLCILGTSGGLSKSSLTNIPIKASTILNNETMLDNANSTNYLAVYV